MEAAERRQQREAARRLRELERRAKEQSKLSEMEQARLEVEAYENRLEMLLSVHKEQSDPWDWAAPAASLPPPPPHRLSTHELKAKQHAAVSPPSEKQHAETLVEQARLEDERLFRTASKAHSQDHARWEKFRNLARRILSGEHKSYVEALVEFGHLGEISDLGSSIHFTVHDAKLLQCVLKVNGTQAIPAEVKTLTSSGKVSTKPMAKARFHEVYQDYVCGCMLRVARETFALLPVDTLLVTASVDALDPRTGQMVEQAVLSAAMPRATILRLEYDRLDPSEAMESFLHRGDFKASRKSGGFVPIQPLTPADLALTSAEGSACRDLLAEAQKARAEWRTEIGRLRPAASLSLS